MLNALRMPWEMQIYLEPLPNKFCIFDRAWSILTKTKDHIKAAPTFIFSLPIISNSDGTSELC